VPKAYEFAEKPAFKSVGGYAARFLKGNFSSTTYLPNSILARITSWQFSKALGATPRHLSAKRGEGLNSSVLKSFQQIQQLLPFNS
jgi:hypothetical protein